MISIKNISKYIYFKGLDILNIDKKYLEDISKNKHLVILNLHKISNDKNPYYPSLSLAHFEYLLKYIVKKFNVITFSEIAQSKTSRKPCLILSFDDGFYDFLENAMPLMKKYNVKSNLNIIPQCVENGLPIWDVLLGDYLNAMTYESINSIDLGDFKMKLTRNNKSQFGLALTHYLKSMTHKERENLWVKIKDKSKEFDIRYTKMLSRSDIETIQKIHEVGAHSYSHESMGISTKEFFENDFLRCHQYFTNTLNIPLTIYAFPSGSYRNEQIRFLQENGVKHILLVNDKYANNNDCVYPRFTFYGNSVSEIKMRALGWIKR